MSSDKLGLLFVSSCVSMRTDEMNPTMGFLCLAKQEEPLTFIFAWVPRRTIPADEVHMYLEVAGKTRKARALFSRPDSTTLVTTPTQTLSAITEAISAPLDDIQTIGIANELTLADGAEICLVRLIVTLTFEGAQLPDLWFEKDESGRAPSIVDVETELRGWFSAIGKDLVRRNQDDEERPSSSTPYLYDLRPKSNEVTRPESPHRWPEGWPSIPQGSTIHRIGTYGFNVVTNIVGQPMADKIEGAGWNMLERFSKVTNYAKSTTVQVLEHPLARPILPFIPQNIRSYFLSSGEAEALLEEYEPAGHYLAVFAAELQSRLGQHPPQLLDPTKDTTRDFENLAAGRQHHRTGRPLSAEQWVSWYDTEGRLTVSEQEVKAVIFVGGVEADIRVDVWKYLLKVYPYNSTEVERAELVKEKRAQYADMKAQWMAILTDAANADAAALAAGHKLEERETQAGDEKEDADVVTKIRERKYRVEKDVVRTDRTVPFFAGPQTETNGATSVSPSDMQEVIGANPNLEMLRNVLVTYTVYNFELGYVQGMNDLLAPILVVMQDETDSFWSFVEFMNIMQSNFFRDQSGMRSQLRRLELLIKFVDPYLYAHMESTDSINLFCCFRWLLILFKREFDFGDCMRLWETLWVCPLTKHFHLFVALAILNRHRKDLMGKAAFDETLKFINDLSNQIPLESTLERAEVLFQVFRDRIGETARERLGVDLAVDAPPIASGSFLRPPGKSVQRSPSPVSERGRSREKQRDAMKELECTEEELWELVSLLERR
ncbi:uncharacterized protein SPPG_06364 [Spizellomyces punctatus DAOM BR117]|uniref:Rab-GAP TBC domain-containing protein n=1 Tax=Spizellomyces punctatus (strain DAOM BR117) TaxID=645134 RepID=A0A0L0HCK1_SPIPD|nr:uncharacterized protein SPPG_06364 [Spizellomyces punctatus DAOM BR117]KNC98681.1 hypothetical protein SPPG_06364 [Spizellomyces punctatus DAOM BR117]|eukprot:XP_016606721.1 hypothetical protein SPPG_06364 [Spizellomyces punctatus DAOM BR117]